MFGTYYELPFYVQLNVTIWCLIGFHGNHSYINDIAYGLTLVFLSFQILFKFKLYYFKMTTKLHLAIEIYKIARINYKIVSI